MDVKAKIEDVVKTIKEDEEFSEKFKQDPVAAVKNIVGTDVQNDHLNQIVEGVKAKVSLEDAGDILGKAKGFFKK